LVFAICWSASEFSASKKLVDLVKKIDSLFTAAKEHYADQLTPVKRNQSPLKK
jgi:hypothetical protein